MLKRLSHFWKCWMARRNAVQSSELLERIGGLWHDDTTAAPMRSRMTLAEAHSYNLGYNQALHDAMNEITRPNGRGQRPPAEGGSLE